MPSEISWTRHAIAHYTVYTNLIVAPAGLNAVTGDLGAVDGDDKHCRRVCGVVPGCNMITRSNSSSQCLLHSRCMSEIRATLRATTPGGALPKRRNLRSPQYAVVAGGSTSFTEACLRPNHWGKLDYRLPIEGAHLGVVSASNVAQCREVCDMVPGCNSFARQKKGVGVLCHMKGGCATREDTRLDAADATPAMRQKLMRFRNGRYTSHYRWPCSNETLWPAPGPRRSLPPSIPSGLVSMDCAKGSVARQEGGAAFVFTGSDEPARAIPGYCALVNAPRPLVTSIRWPEFYSPPPHEVIAPPSAAARRRQRLWQGQDAHEPISSDGKGKPLPGGDVPRLFDTAARDVASRSFNGREVVLLTSNVDGLPLAINLMANLAAFGHQHALLLADHPATCRALASATPPACLHSTLLRTDYRRALRTYISNGVWTLWLQRYLYFLRLIRLGLSPMLLDADVLFFHDPYPHLHRAMRNYTLFVLCDSSAGYAGTNGGVIYASNPKPNGPVHHMFAEFERRVTWVLKQYNKESPGQGVIRFDGSAGHRVNQPADTLLYDQTVFNNVMLSEVMGEETSLFTHTRFDRKSTERRPPNFWKIAPFEWDVPHGVGTYGHRYPRRFALRYRFLMRNGVREGVVQAPPWLFSAESDARVPPVATSETNPEKIYPGRPAAAWWGAQPAPAVLVHFVCAAWPGSGGRLAAMQLWGKWYYRDVGAQLSRGQDATARGGVGSVAGGGGQGGGGGGRGRGKPHFKGSDGWVHEQSGFDAHSWLRVCGDLCAVGNCLKPPRGRGGGPGSRGDGFISLCHSWLEKSSWQAKPMSEWANAHPAASRALQQQMIAGVVPTAPFVTLLEVWARRQAEQLAPPMPLPLAHAVASARTLHPAGLIAFSRPLAAADRREYQLYVHLLMSAAMLSGRVPVLPLSLCASIGEWAEHSRCVYVMHTRDGQRWCVMRPPSPCLGKIALPNSLEGVADSEIAVARLPRLPLRNGSVDVISFGGVIASAGVSSRVLLLDIAGLRSADDVSNLLVTPKGWLCTLEHKSCQMAC